MADTSALISIENAVTDFLLAYKKSTDDYYIYLRHSLLLLQDYMTYDAPDARTEKVSVNSLGIIDIPTDCIRIKDVCIAKDGEWWTFTERPNKVNTTTTTLGVEGQDSTFGEGVAVKDSALYNFGTRGGINAYYYTVDWKARRIFCDGIVSDTVVLRYVSNGIALSGTTYIPSLLVQLLDAYLLLKETYWIPELVRERQLRQNDFDKERLRVRNLLNSMTADQWRDVIWGTTGQTPQR